MSTSVTVVLEPYDGLAHTASDFMDKVEFAAMNVPSGQENGVWSVMYDTPTYVARTGRDGT